MLVKSHCYAKRPSEFSAKLATQKIWKQKGFAISNVETLHPGDRDLSTSWEAGIRRNALFVYPKQLLRRSASFSWSKIIQPHYL